MFKVAAVVLLNDDGVGEEAGVVGNIGRYLGEKIVKRKSNSKFFFYELNVTDVKDEWPEKSKRTRKWVSIVSFTLENSMKTYLFAISLAMRKL